MGRFSRGICATVALLSGCSGLQSPIGAPSASRQDSGIPTADAPYRVLYRFRGNFDGVADGSDPKADLIDVNGTLYGTTYGGGAKGAGTVFSVATNGTEKVLHSFGRGSDGAAPSAGLINVNGTLYGTTAYGGGSGACGGLGCGTAFSITTTGSEKVLYRFAGGRDGALPCANLIDVGDKLYGTTAVGGSTHDGTIFSLTTTGTKRVLHNFKGKNDGAYPSASLIDVNGTLYGTTRSGGLTYGGTVFSVTPSGTERVVYAFGGGYNGSYPSASLIAMNGTLYGTTYSGGAHGAGAVYSVTTTGKEKVRYSFAGGSNGEYPSASLVNVNGTLFGTTYQGGGSVCSGGCGTLYRVSTTGAATVMYRFAGGSDGVHPAASLIDVNGTLYGTTSAGGQGCRRRGPGCGTVFAFTPPLLVGDARRPDGH